MILRFLEVVPLPQVTLQGCHLAQSCIAQSLRLDESQKSAGWPRGSGYRHNLSSPNVPQPFLKLLSCGFRTKEPLRRPYHLQLLASPSPSSALPARLSSLTFSSAPYRHRSSPNSRPSYASRPNDLKPFVDTASASEQQFTGHSLRLHSSDLSREPLQACPPNLTALNAQRETPSGWADSAVRSWSRRALPHVAVHSLQSAQSFQLQSTGHAARVQFRSSLGKEALDSRL